MSDILEKTVWSGDDFETMGWHDATVYGIAILSDSLELVFDVDYILKWVNPVSPSPNYSFWVSPATLAFQRVQGVEFSFPHIEQPTIQDIHRFDPRPTPTAGLTDWQWNVELDQGTVSFRAYGFRQHFRHPPVHIESQEIGLNRRGGVSFAREWNAATV